MEKFHLINFIAAFNRAYLQSWAFQMQYTAQIFGYHKVIPLNWYLSPEQTLRGGTILSRKVSNRESFASFICPRHPYLNILGPPGFLRNYHYFHILFLKMRRFSEPTSVFTSQAPMDFVLRTILVDTLENFSKNEALGDSNHTEPFSGLSKRSQSHFNALNAWPLP